VISALLFALSAHAASFDCAKARTKVEHIICDTPEISKLDDELNTAYKAALQDVKQAVIVKQAQKRWMKERDRCADSACVMHAYANRLSTLQMLAETPEASPAIKKRFVVTEGKGFSICESYADFLNSLPENEPLPLCHLKRSPDFPSLKDPDWEEMDISSNLQLVYMLEKKLSPSMHNRPVDTFDHWKDIYEQQIKSGDASPRLRRTHLALLPDAPVETILAYEPDSEWCNRDMRRQGFAYVGVHTKLFLWNEQEQRIENSRFYIGSASELLLFQGKPLLFFTSWGKDVNKGWVGKIYVDHFVSAGVENQYGRVPRCTISYGLPSIIIERMTK
jgi:uncharacterized protein YecT (DUF1311 family)